MKPFRYNPEVGLTREEMINEASSLVLEFCEKNKICAPKLDVEWRTCVVPGDKWRSKGYYAPGTSVLHVNEWRAPTKTPGFAWSFPGYKADMTVYGVLAHELGHYIQDQVFDWSKTKRDLLAFKDKRDITSYECFKNPVEMFAGMMRLFILNPDLLHMARPEHYKYLVMRGLNPLHQKPWDWVLENGHRKFYEAAHSWMSERPKREISRLWPLSYAIKKF